MATIIKGKNKNRPYTVRYFHEGIRELMDLHKIGYPKAKQMQEALMNGGK